jgi:hypothetical protein
MEMIGGWIDLSAFGLLPDGRFFVSRQLEAAFYGEELTVFSV